MPNGPVSGFPTVTTPASTDEFGVNQGGTTKKETRAQIHTLESGEVFLADSGSISAPGIAFNGNPTTGFLQAGDIIGITLAASQKFIYTGDVFQANASGGGALRNATATATLPSLCPDRSNLTTGLGRAATDVLSIIAGSIEGIRLTETSNAIIQAVEADVGLTAHTDSAQGAGVILSSYNIYSTVANAGDAATLPATFIVGTLIYIKNDGANNMDVFPASGDDAGGGANTAVVVANGNFAVFFATTANATWTKLMGGTA